MVEQVVNGRTEMFELIVKQYRQHLYSCVYAVLRHPKDAEDALQEAFVRIYLSLPQYQGQGFRTWVTRIAVNMAIDHKRRIRRRQENLAGGMGTETALQESGDRTVCPGKEIKRNPEDERRTAAAYTAASEAVDSLVLKEERRARIHEMIHTLPEGYRNVVQAFYLEEKSRKEIAELERVELKTVESRLYRARQWMRKHWKEEDWE